MITITNELSISLENYVRFIVIMMFFSTKVTASRLKLYITDICKIISENSIMVYS